MLLYVYGVHVDREGGGIPYYDYRTRGYNGFDRKGKHTIISVFAGLIAQQKFLPNCSLGKLPSTGEISFLVSYRLS